MTNACTECQFGRCIKRQATSILDEIVTTAHMEGGSLVVELSDRSMLDLFLWRSSCEGCESGEEYGDGPEPWDMVIERVCN